VGDLRARLETGPTVEDIASGEVLLIDDHQFTNQIARYRVEIAAIQKESLDSIHQSEELENGFEDLQCEALDLHPPGVAQRNADRQRVADLKSTASLFVDHAFQLSDVIIHTFIRFPDLSLRRNTVTRDRERFGQLNGKVIEEMRFMVLHLREGRGKWHV
jgi:hypothetical protein